MPEHSTIRNLAQAIISESPATEEALDTSVAGPDGSDVVRALLKWPDGRVRFWAMNKAESVLPQAEFVRYLRSAAHDADDAVSAEAVSRLAVVDPGFIRRRVRALRAKLKEDGPSGQKILAIWTLCRVASKESIASIEGLRSAEPNWTKLARVADVAIRYLRDGGDQILNDIRLRADHDHMEELCTLAWFVIADDKARQTLEECAASASDDRWKRECAYGLTRFGES